MFEDLVALAAEATELIGLDHLDDYLELLTMDIECPVCGGQGQVQGFLGQLTHYRCRNCGMWFSIDTPKEQM